MQKSIKIPIILFLTLLLNFFIISYYPKALSYLNLVQDSQNNNELPSHFRKSSDKITLAENQKLNLKGLDKLNISGSAQFSETPLILIKEAIAKDFSIIDIDLREESHGFINGIAVSFKNEKNNANKGLSLQSILEDEVKRLEAIPLNTSITFFNNKKTITPTSVKNEALLTEENNIDYIRIPVTDGGLPSEDMVKYFVDFVENQPENTWIHFHCKAGIGRTTTFMIMYDIMKNCKEVDLNDIITRQIILSKMKETDSKDFYSGEKLKFLTDFYNKCKNNKLSFSEPRSTSISTGDGYSYIKNSITPNYLYVISEKDMTKEEQTMIASLQGVISNKSTKQIYILSSNEPDYEIWLKDLEQNYNIKYRVIKDPWKLLSKFKAYTNGYILYKSSNPSSINNACTLASLKKSIVIDKSLEEKVNYYGINKLTFDCSDTDKYWAFNNLWNCGLNYSTVIQLSPDKSISLRDYCIMSKSLIFYEDDINNTDLRERIFNSMDGNSLCLGWGPDEHTNVSIASKFGVNMIAADWSYNLSTLSSYPSTPQTQKLKKEIKNKDGLHYVTFIMSDGDNQQWFLGNNFSSNKWYGSPHRGNLNLGWSISPSIYYLAPTVFNKYYESAGSLKYSDNFVVPPSGNGYIYPSKYPVSQLDNYTKTLSDYMYKVDQSNVLILDDNAFYRIDLWDKYTCHLNIDGLFYLNYNKHNSYNGEILWSNNKPIVSCRDLLWGGLEDEDKLIKNINDRVALGYTDIKNSLSYTFVYVHVWSNSMDNVQRVVNKLNENPKVRIVTPDTFMTLIKNNVSPAN